MKPGVGGRGNYGMLKETKAKGSNPANLNFVGGMRNPTETVAGNTKAMEMASTYGTADCVFDRATVERWRAELRKLTGSQGKPSVDL